MPSPIEETKTEQGWRDFYFVSSAEITAMKSYLSSLRSKVGKKLGASDEALEKTPFTTANHKAYVNYSYLSVLHSLLSPSTTTPSKAAATLASCVDRLTSTVGPDVDVTILTTTQSWLGVITQASALKAAETKEKKNGGGEKCSKKTKDGIGGGFSSKNNVPPPPSTDMKIADERSSLCRFIIELLQSPSNVGIKEDLLITLTDVDVFYLHSNPSDAPSFSSSSSSDGGMFEYFNAVSESISNLRSVGVTVDGGVENSWTQGLGAVRYAREYYVWRSTLYGRWSVGQGRMEEGDGEDIYEKVE